MTDKALLIGINQYPDAPLAGCVNDVNDMAEFLVGAGFPHDGIRLLVDRRATAAAIMERLAWLVADARPGDRLVLHYSGHGVQLPNRGPGAEVDGMDECICVVGDTRILLLDGTERTIEELAAADAPFWVYSSTADGHVTPSLADKARLTGRARPVVKVTLDNGESVRCTPEHRWLLRDGTYREAKDLRPEDSLMPLYRKMRRGKNGRPYEAVLHQDTELWEETHRITAGECPQDVKDKAKQQDCGAVRHHVNCNSRDNRPENMLWMTWDDHLRHHTASDEHRKAASVRFKAMWADPEFRARRIQAMVEEARLREHSPEMRARRSAAAKQQDLTPMHAGGRRYIDSLTPDQRTERSRLAGSSKKPGEGFSKRMKKRWEDPEYRKFMIERQRASMTRRWQDPDYRASMTGHGQRPHNHKVVSVEAAGAADVYDMTVPGPENFAVAAGVFLHNCPVNFDWTDARAIRDKQLGRAFDGLPDGVRLTLVSDSCHSGDLSRGIPRPGRAAGRPRSMPVPADIAWRARTAQHKGLKVRPFVHVHDSFPGVLISGCRSDETSADASFKRRPNGALTRMLLDELSVNRQRPVADVVATVRARLKKAGYTQHPQIEGRAASMAGPFV